MKLRFLANCCRPFPTAAARCSISSASAAATRRNALRPLSNSAATCCPAAVKPPASHSLARFLARYSELTTGPRIAFFEALATRYGVDRTRLEAARRRLAGAPSD
jgi:hypothetical protein